MNSADNTSDIWTVKRALDWTIGYLQRKGDENPRVSAEWLITEACGLSRIDLYLNPERPLDRGELDVLHDYVARRGTGEPLQYITGEAPFRYLTIKVRPGVLIPRPETEVLVSEALACLPAAAKREARWSEESSAKETEAIASWKARIEAAMAEAEQEDLAQAEAEDGDPARNDAERDSGAADPSDPSDPDDPSSDTSLASGNEGAGEPSDPSPAASLESSDEGAGMSPYFLVADVCTGSGCIACSIASERPDTRVIAVDVSDEAVALARQNVADLHLDERIKVLQGDLGSPVPKRFLGRFSLVVSNPPYVPTRVLAEVPQEVSAFEPALALDGGADGLDVFRRLAPWAHRALKAGGSFVCELHEGHLEDAASIALECGFASAKTVNDLAGRPRVLVCRR